MMCESSSCSPRRRREVRPAGGAGDAVLGAWIPRHSHEHVWRGEVHAVARRSPQQSLGVTIALQQVGEEVFPGLALGLLLPAAGDDLEAEHRRAVLHDLRVERREPLADLGHEEIADVLTSRDDATDQVADVDAEGGHRRQDRRRMRAVDGGEQAANPGAGRLDRPLRWGTGAGARVDSVQHLEGGAEQRRRLARQLGDRTQDVEGRRAVGHRLGHDPMHPADPFQVLALAGDDLAAFVGDGQRVLLVGDVASAGVDQAAVLGRHRPPHQPAPLSGLGAEAVLEVVDDVARLQVGDRGQGRVDVLRMDEVDERLGRQLLLREAQHALEGVVDALEVAVGPGHTQEVEREVEESRHTERSSLDLALISRLGQHTHAHAPPTGGSSPSRHDRL